ncbi:MAG: hypothetical protein ABUL64_04270, partial [Singulisphaera sp.]
MPIPWFRTIALGGCPLLLLMLAGAVAAGQPPETPRRATSEPAAPMAEGTVKEAQPPVLFLRNKDGGLLQAVLGFTLEDFERFMNQRAQLGLGQQPSRYQLDRLTARAQAGDRQADLTVELSVVVNQTSWVRIPLRMSEAVLRSKPRYQGSGDSRLEFDPVAREYVLWLRGELDEPQLVTLEIAVPLEKRAEQTELKLGMPRATVSELTLRVDDPDAVATVREGGLLDSTVHNKETTEFKILGLERDFVLAWQQETAADAEPSAPLDATTIFDTRVDPAGVHTDVVLTVRTFGAKLDSFRISIPRQAKLTG